MRINKLNISSGENKNIEEKVDLYINIFGEEPWNEWYIDGNGTLYPLSYQGNKEWLKKFYDKDILAKQRTEWSQKQWYIECLAEVLDNNALVGFILGRSNSLYQLNIDKFNLNLNEYQVLVDNISKMASNINLEKLFYAADLWITPDYRNCWIASKLYNARYEQILNNWETAVIVRTTKNRSVPYNWYINKWFQEVYNYNDQQNRVIMVLSI